MILDLLQLTNDGRNLQLAGSFEESAAEGQCGTHASAHGSGCCANDDYDANETRSREKYEFASCIISKEFDLGDSTCISKLQLLDGVLECEGVFLVPMTL